MEKLLQFIALQIQILQIQLWIKLLKEKLTVPNLARPIWIIIHHGAGPLNFDQVNRYHTKKWGFVSSLGFGIGYQYFIGYSGIIEQGRADNEEGAHTIGFNKCSIGICLQGNLDIEKPTEWQLKSLKELIDKKKLKYGIDNAHIDGHRHFGNTSCPGHLLYPWLVQNYPNY